MSPINGSTKTKSKDDKVLFPVVGVGASAGGLEPLEELFSQLSADTEIAFIVVQHSDPTHETLLPAILARRTKLSVVKAQNGMSIDARCIYICPSDVILTVLNGKFQLTLRTKTHEPVLAIDQFFRSLASEFQNRAIAVVLSGTGSDGSLGLREVKEKGGITFAQDEKTSKFYSMPQNAAATGAVDFVLSPGEIANHLKKIAHHEYLTCESNTIVPEGLREEGEDFKSLIAMIYKSSGVDFSQYKHGTVSRRISRRMALHNIKTLSEFGRFLKDNPEALKAVGHDILIQVTKFFREPEAFGLLKEKVFPNIVDKRSVNDPIRIWIPGCSSGEEVYSVLMSLIEFLEERGHRFPVQIFGTDLSETAIEKARGATYVENISLDVSPERLSRFFTKVGNSYEIHKSLRDMCIFARHNIVTDPPFGKLDLVSCRNVLIYLERTLQKRALSIFHYALKSKGILILGNAETVDGAAELFSSLDTRFRFYEKKPMTSRLYFDFVGAQNTAEKISIPTVSGNQGESVSKGVQMQRDADRFLLGEFVPASILVSDKLEVIQFRGQTGAYFEHSPGFASFDLLGMLKSGLVTDVRNALETSREKKEPVRKEEIRLRSNEDVKRIAVEVFPMSLPSNGERYFIIIFEDMELPKYQASKVRREIKRASRPTHDEAQELSSVRAELASTKEYLQSVNEEKEATNEELKAANEEILSSNEELQSTNEELHSAKEELQSTNEELLTVNDELKIRNQDLSLLNDDLANLFNSLNSAMVLLTKDLRVRRFTPLAENLLRLIPGDIGRSINDIRSNIEIKELQKLLLDVITTVIPKELEVEDHQGKWYSVQIKPYRTNEGRIEGAVLLFTDITKLKTSLIYAEAVESIIAHPLLVLGGDLLVKRANKKFYDFFKTTPQDTENRFIYELGNGQWNIPELRKLLEEVLPKHSEFKDFEITHDFPAIGQTTMRLDGRRLFYNDKATETILLALVSSRS